MTKKLVKIYVFRPKYAPSSDNEEEDEHPSDNSESDEEVAKASTSKARLNSQSTINNGKLKKGLLLFFINQIHKSN